jgi:hypothetical protein
LLEGKFMRLRNIKAHTRPAWLFAVMLLCWSLSGRTQGPAPETAPPLFPGGGLVSYNSSFVTRGLTPQLSLLTARPTFSHKGDFNFTWGFHPDLDLAVVVPVITNHFNAAPISLQGTGLGDAMVLVKYRFFRRDSQRGTTQASVTAGPKLPTGQTGLTDGTGNRLPAGLQPGSGSTDFFIAANWTYTGLFNLRRLVADEDFHSLLRSIGTQATNLGSDVESRFWLSYRPYEAKDGSREWFVGPVLTWLYSRDESVAGITQQGSGTNALLAGATTYVGLRPGMHVWFGMDWDIAHSAEIMSMPIRRHVSFGVTQQFRMHL